MKVPYNKEKNEYLTYESYGGYEMLEIPGPFPAELEFVGANRGRSACNFKFKHVGVRGTVYTFRLAEFEKVVPHMVNGVVKGVFKFNKRGANYSLELV
jgi:hypothetical protein